MTIPKTLTIGGDWVPPGMDYPVFHRYGYGFAIRYVVPSIVGKLVTLAEVMDAHAAGVDMAFVYETSGVTWHDGFTQGAHDGESARNALASLTAPVSVCAYHAVDSQVSPSQIGIVLDWLAGVETGMFPYRTGVYAEFAVIEAVAAHMPQVYRWQTPAWSNGQESSYAELFQTDQRTLAGVTFDFDVARTRNFGQWFANPADQPTPHQEDRMSTGLIAPGINYPVPVEQGAVTAVALYCDFIAGAADAQSVRVAVHSAGKGYSQIEEVTLTDSSPHHLMFTEHDVNAVSFARHADSGARSVGFVIY